MVAGHETAFDFNRRKRQSTENTFVPRTLARDDARPASTGNASIEGIHSGADPHSGSHEQTEGDLDVTYPNGIRLKLVAVKANQLLNVPELEMPKP